MIEYATQQDVEDAFNGLPPDNAEALRLAATALVLRATRGVVYATDGTGRATDEDVVAAFTNAVLQQVQWWNGAGVDPTVPTPTTGRIIQSTNLGGGSVTYADADERVAERAAMGETVAPLARAYLEAAGLTTRGVVVYG